MERRDFLKKLGIFTLALPVLKHIKPELEPLRNIVESPEQVAASICCSSSSSEKILQRCALVGEYSVKYRDYIILQKVRS